jgi:hypothetical protein
MEGAHKLRQRVVGSRTRFLITASVLVLLWLVFVWLAATGRLAELRYLNVPLLHQYPPAGYVQNPFNPSDKGDLVSVSEASRVKADLLADGQTELLAAEKGDVRLLSGAVTGRALDSFTSLIQQNNSQGISERAQNHFDSIVVGHLSDPNDPKIVWAIEEKGTATVLLYSKSTGASFRQTKVRFDSTYWLTVVANHYLITDALIRTETIP